MKDNIINNHIGLVRCIAGKYRYCGVPFEDLEQEGLLGLIDAHKRYDETKGASFSTYSSYWIKKRILKALEKEHEQSLGAVELDDRVISADENGGDENEYTVSGSISLPEKFPDIEAKVIKLCFEDQNTLNEISELLGISRERVRQVKAKALRRIKLNKELTESLYAVNNNSV